MGVNYIFEPGDTIYYPRIADARGKPMTVKDYQVYQGKKGIWAQYLSDDLLDRLIEDMHQNIERHYDNLLVITGAEGTGKSNLAYWVAKKFDPEFSMEEGYIYDMGPFLEKLDTQDLHGKVFWMDEATNIASNRDWMKDANKSLIQLLEMLRSRGMTLVMCIPLLDRIDIYIRETRMRYHLQTNERNWHEDTEIKRGYFELKSKESKFKTVCWGTFAPMPPEESKIYEELKSKHQTKKVREIRQRFEEDTKPGSRLQKSAEYNRKLAWLLMRDANMSYQEISEETGIPEGTLRSWMHYHREYDEE